MIWRDAYFARSIDEHEGEYLVRSCGYLVGEDNGEMVLAQSITPNEPAELLHIPLSLVVSREVVKPVPTMSLMTSIGAQSKGETVGSQ